MSSPSSSMLKEVSGSVLPTAPLPGQIERALSSATLADLERLLSLESTDVRSQTFWHNMTPLHLACMRSSEPSAVARLLLSHGAAVDQVNAFGETPLMFACKRGVPELVAVLLAAGADPLARDSAGRGLVHHAAMSGSTAVVHFLRTVLGMSCKDVDGRRQTPLHIVTSIGHIELLRYLLRQRQRGAIVDIHAADVFGNTALHVAATNGHSRITWELLVKGGKNLVLAENKESRTPLDIAQQLNSWKHRETLQVLRHARKLCATRREFEGPVAAWYWHLAMPTCLSLVALVVATFLQDWIGGHAGALLLAAALLAVAAIVYRHSHRMEHVCDWPNPVYAGAFGGGMLLTIVCHLYLLCSSLSDRFLLLICTGILIFGLFHTYHRLLFGDPGFVDFGKDESNSVSSCRSGAHTSNATDLGLSEVRARAIADAASTLAPSTELFCSVCEIYREEDVKHCRLCDRCVLAMDHHCLYLMKCVAGKNHRRFVAFIALVLLSQLTFLSAAGLHIEVTFVTSPFDAGTLQSDVAAVAVISRLLRTELFLSAMVFLNAISVIWGANVLGWQLKLVAHGLTYYKSVKCEDESAPQVAIRDQLHNILSFFSGVNAHGKTSCRQQCCTV